MHKFISIFLVLLMSMSFLCNDAYAKRFGGGRSFGVSRPASHSTSYSRMNNATNKPSLGNRLLGPIAGLITGGLLASLFMGHGLGTGILTWLMIAGAGLLLFRLLAMRRNVTPQPAEPKSERLFNNNFFTGTSNSESPQSQNTYQAQALPTNFDSQQFLRDAKKQFIRLQAAYDEKNLIDLRRFTSPEVYAEIQMQLQERGDKPNQTDVISLDAILLDVTDESQQEQLASVKFSGTIKEDTAQAEPFTETWHFRKSSFSTEWVVAGIEQ